MSVSDDEYVLDLNKMKMADLKKELQLRDLKVSGNKQDLIQRLQQYLEEHEGAEVEAGDDDALLELNENESKVADISSGEDKLEKSLLDESQSKELEVEDNAEELLDDKTTKVSEESAVEKEAVKEDETVTPPEDTKEASPEPKVLVKSTQPLAAMTEEEKKEQRAKKYGIKVTELPEDKKLDMRKKRFGMGKSSITDHKVEVDAEKLKKRAERFGAVVSSVLTDKEQEEKIRKRKERFGEIVSSETDAKKQKRAERFGLKVAS